MGKIKGKLKALLVIPTLNCLEYTKQTLNCLALAEPFGTMIIDNGSVDGTREWLRANIKTPNFFLFEAKQNLGVSGSWNYGIQFGLEVLGVDYIFILNNDILLLPQTLDLMLEVLKKSDVGLTSAFNVSDKTPDEKNFFELKIPEDKTLTEAPDFSCFAVNRRVIEKVGLFDEAFYPAYFEDNDYHYRMRLEGLKALKVHKALYFHFGSRTRIMDKEFREYLDARYSANREYYRSKWGGEPGQEKFKIPFNGNVPEKITLDNFGYDPEEIIKNLKV